MAVIERPKRRSWRAGYVIVPIALIVGSLQVLIPSHRDGLGSLEAERAAKAPQAERQPQESPLPDPRPLVNGPSAADEAAVAPIPIQVVIHHAAGARNALPAIQLAAFLQTRGFDVSDIRPVDVEIERPSVRYFFAGDQPETRRLVEAIAAFFAKAPDQAPHEAADLSHSSPKPRRGNIEVWLPPAAGGSQST